MDSSDKQESDQSNLTTAVQDLNLSTAGIAFQLSVSLVSSAALIRG